MIFQSVCVFTELTDWLSKPLRAKWIFIVIIAAYREPYSNCWWTQSCHRQIKMSMLKQDQKSVIWSCCCSILAVETISSTLLSDGKADSSQSFNKRLANGSERNTSWKTVQFLQTNLHSTASNLFDICLLLASHKHIFACSDNAK